MAKPVLKRRLTVKKPPTPTSTGNVTFMDHEDKRNFADPSMAGVQPGQVLEVECTHNPATTKNGKSYDESYNIVTWKQVNDQPQLPMTPPKPFTRPRTDPVDQKQIYMSVMLKGWNAAYAQFLSITPGDMKKVDAAFVQQAMQAYSTAYDQFYGSMTQSNKAPIEDDMNDEIPI